MTAVLRIAVLLLLLDPVRAAAQGPAAAVELRARHAAVAPTIDGILDDQVWAADPLPLETWVSYNPLRGEPARQQTSVWIGYDRDALYFAFKCYDPEPGRIRSTISRRDSVWNDDWVAVSLDSTRAGQVAYHMFVNPSGIQIDALNSGASGEDASPDWVWQSAGRVDEDGYTVEIRLPLQSIRFSGGTDVRMGVMFFRRNSRLGISWSWPELRPGQWVFETHVPLVVDELRQPRLLEVIPSATVSSNQARADNGRWAGSASRGDVGASVKYGITSTMTLDATVNPDFSQVESDAFQVEVNQRFPLFFSEKRPFFMEGLGLFELAGAGGDGTLRTAVHTRRIVDPNAGVKVTGTAGRQTFALLSAADESPAGDRSRKFTVGRGIHNFGRGQYVGGLITDSEFGAAYNRVAAVDTSIRAGEHLRWNGAVIFSDSASETGDRTSGIGATTTWEYGSRRYNILGQVEHFDREFQMDTAFINRVGVTRTWQYGEVQFYPDEKRHGWIKRIAPFVWGMTGEDRVQGGSELFVLPGIRFNFTRQGNLRLHLGRGHETFAGQRFRSGTIQANGGAQILRWLNIGGSINRGPGIFYDPAAPFGGTSRFRSVNVGLQPNPNLNHDLSYDHVTFDNAAGERVFGVHVVNLRNTYQFTSRFLLRAITQYDSSRRRVLADLLASYELQPGTVVHLGYGSLLESEMVPRPYTATARAFFFKASYLARF
jgi:hypothetical protein